MDSVIIHPTPLLQIADHYIRYDEEKVVGIILGNTTNGIHITNTFALPYEEDLNNFFIDTSYLQSMHALVKKISVDEKILGWYHTGQHILKYDQEITRYIETLTELPAIALLVDLESSDTPIRAYNLKDNDFVYVNTLIEAEEAEEVGVEHLVRDIKGSDKEILDGLKVYKESLDNILKYLDDVLINGGDNEIMGEIQECLNDIPRIELGEMSSIYLGSLVKNVVRLKDLEINRKENSLRDGAVY